MEKPSSNGAGKNPVVTHPPHNVSGNTGPTQVVQVTGLEGTAKALEAASITNRLLLICSALGCLVSVGLSVGALVLGIMNHGADVAAIKRIDDERSIAVQKANDDLLATTKEFSQWADLTYARELKVDAELAASGVRTEKFGRVPQPPTKR